MFSHKRSEYKAENTGHYRLLFLCHKDRLNTIPKNKNGRWLTYNYSWYVYGLSQILVTESQIKKCKIKNKLYINKY